MCIHIHSVESAGRRNPKTCLYREVLTQKQQILIFQVMKGFLVVLATLYPISYVKSQQCSHICFPCMPKAPPPMPVRRALVPRHYCDSQGPDKLAFPQES